MNMEEMDLQALRALTTEGLSLHQKVRRHAYIEKLEREARAVEAKLEREVSAVKVVDRGPEVTITRRTNAVGEQARTACVFGDRRTLESAIDEAFGLAGPGEDVVVWLGDRVAAVISADDRGKPRVATFIDPDRRSSGRS
jgi:hypothetical protein